MSQNFEYLHFYAILKKSRILLSSMRQILGAVLFLFSVEKRAIHFFLFQNTSNTPLELNAQVLGEKI